MNAILLHSGPPHSGSVVGVTVVTGSVDGVILPVSSVVGVIPLVDVTIVVVLKAGSEVEGSAVTVFVAGFVGSVTWS